MSSNPTKLTINGDGRPRFVVVKPQKMFESKGGEVYTPTTVKGYVGKAVDLDGATEYCSKASPTDLAMNGPEKVTNTGFEMDTAGWAQVGNHSMSRTTADFQSGIACLEVVATGAGSGSNCIYQTFAGGGQFVIGKTYTLDFWAKSVAGNTNLHFEGFSGSYPGQNLSLTGSWTRYRMTVKAVATNTGFVFWLGGAGTFRLDNISITEAYDFSLLAWVRTSTVTANEDILNNNSYAFRLYKQITTGRLFAAVFDGVDTVASGSNGGFADDQWHLLVGSFVRSGNAAVYVDGNIGLTTPAMSGLGKPTYGTMTIGAFLGGGGGLFNGLIGELQIVRGYALSAAEIAAIYANGIPWGHAQGTVVAHYRWRGTTDADFLKDESASGNNLTGMNVTQAADQVSGSYKTIDRLTAVARVNHRVVTTVGSVLNETFGKVVSVDDTNDQLVIDGWTYAQPADGTPFAIDGFVVDMPRTEELTEEYDPYQVVQQLWRGRESARFYGYRYSVEMDYATAVMADTIHGLAPVLNRTKDDRLILIPRADKPQFQYNVRYLKPFKLAKFGRARGW